MSRRDPFDSNPITPIRSAMTIDDLRRHEPFLSAYREIRRREGRGESRPDDLLRLPDGDVAATDRSIWRLRRQSLEWLREEIGGEGNALSILDAGAGNCWLTRHLAAWGHDVTALDINDDAWDGLGAGEWYQRLLPIRFERLLADFAAIPMEDRSLDLIVYNGAIHYAHDLPAVIAEGARLLAEGGRLIVMDSPVYHDARSGERMVAERGGPTRSGYLVSAAVEAIAVRHDLSLRWIPRPAGQVDKLRRLALRARLRREPASMPWIVVST